MTDTTLWWLTLAAGLVVAVVAVALLHLLLRAVTRIQTELEQLWAEAGRVAANTSTTWLLEDTHVALGEVEDEWARRHEEEEPRP